MTVQTLPAAEGERLLELRTSSRTEFLRRVTALWHAGWPMRAIGAPLNSGRSTVRAWILAAEHLDYDDVEVERPMKQHVVRLRPDVPRAELLSLQELARRARGVNRWLPAEADARHASTELDARLNHYVQRGVTVQTLANRLGVTRRAIAARLERRAEQTSETFVA